MGSLQALDDKRVEQIGNGEIDGLPGRQAELSQTGLSRFDDGVIPDPNRAADFHSPPAVKIRAYALSSGNSARDLLQDTILDTGKEIFSPLNLVIHCVVSH